MSKIRLPVMVVNVAYKRDMKGSEIVDANGRAVPLHHLAAALNESRPSAVVRAERGVIAAALRWQHSATPNQSVPALTRAVWRLEAAHDRARAKARAKR